MVFGSRLGISNHLIRRVIRHRSMATLFRAASPAAGLVTPLVPRALDLQTVVAAVLISDPDEAPAGGPLPSYVPQELGAATFEPESDWVAGAQGPADSVPSSTPARVTALSPLQNSPLRSGIRPPVNRPAQVMPSGSAQAPAAPWTADGSSAPLLPAPPVESPDTSSTITDDVWRRLRTIFERHQSTDKPPTQGLPDAISQQGDALVPPSPLPGEAPAMEAVSELPVEPPLERSTEENVPPAAPPVQPSRTIAHDTVTSATQIDAGDRSATDRQHGAAHPAPAADMDITGQPQSVLPPLTPDSESSPQPLEQVWDVERIEMRPPEPHESPEDTRSQAELSNVTLTRATPPSEAHTVIQAHRPAMAASPGIAPSIEPPVEAPPREELPSEASPIVTAIDGQTTEDHSTEAGSESVRQLLDQVAAGGPTQSAIEVLLPRRPRPPAQRPTAPRGTTATPTIAPEPSMVQTAIGPLPSDLWDLIDEPVPGVPQPVPQLGDREQSRSDGPALTALAHPSPIPTAESDGPPLPHSHQPSRHVERTDEQTRSAPDAADTTPVTQRRSGEPAGGLPREPRAPTAGAPMIQRTLAPSASAMPVTAPPSEMAGPSAPPDDREAQASEDEPAPGIDVAELARRVYAEIKRRLSVERERSPWH